jgi:hypothetical protein
VKRLFVTAQIRNINRRPHHQKLRSADWLLRNLFEERDADELARNGYGTKRRIIF